MGSTGRGLVGRTARSAAWNWLALAVGTLVAFFLSPFLVHNLGNTTYGVWVLITSLTSYMGLLDLGIRGAVTRFVARDHARNDHVGASAAVSAALWTRQWIGLGVVTLTAAIAASLDPLFDIPDELGSEAVGACVLAGLSVAVALVFGVFGGVLAALHRFDLLGGVVIVQNLVRAGGIVWLIRNGHGIRALAALELGVGLAMHLAQFALCRRVYPELRVSFRHPGGRHVRVLWDFSVYAFLMGLFGTLVNYTDNLVVGGFVSVAAVTFFSIGASLTEQIRHVTGSLTTTLAPLASSLEGTGEHAKLQMLLVQGTRVGLLVGLPLIVALFLRGETFICLWMGEEYGPVSGRVLQILLAARLFTVANSAGMNVALGISKHKRIAQLVGFEAAVNLILSLWLVRDFGIYGVAVGTLVPGLLVWGVLMPTYLCRAVRVPMATYLLRAWLSPILSALPFALACYLTDEYWSPANLFDFFLQVGTVFPVYLLGAAICFRRELLDLLGDRRARSRAVHQAPRA